MTPDRGHNGHNRWTAEDDPQAARSIARSVMSAVVVAVICEESGIVIEVVTAEERVEERKITKLVLQASFRASRLT